MKKSIFFSVLLLLPLTGMAASYTIDPQHTYPNFTISHLGFSTLHGRFGKTRGTLTMDRAKGTGSVDIVIDVASVDTGFKKRDDHLRSPDFFNAVEFPEITFKSTKVTYRGKGATVQGDLTIKGVTRPISLDVKSINCGVHPFSKKQVCGFDATARLKRSDFGIKYALPAVGDEVNLELEVEASKN
ncbi:MAG TPA: polyisoprenoid-binding protein [Gammaproteobacteria bacterium]|nr:polyisoprenoid-binding protein [Gammaproteobacteria bacterium]